MNAFELISAALEMDGAGTTTGKQLAVTSASSSRFFSKELPAVLIKELSSALDKHKVSYSVDENQCKVTFQLHPSLSVSIPSDNSKNQKKKDKRNNFNRSNFAHNSSLSSNPTTAIVLGGMHKIKRRFFGLFKIAKLLVRSAHPYNVRRFHKEVNWKFVIDLIIQRKIKKKKKGWRNGIAEMISTFLRFTGQLHILNCGRWLVF